VNAAAHAVATPTCSKCLISPPCPSGMAGASPPEHPLTCILSGTAVLLLLAAAWNDLATRLIPNRVSLLVAGVAGASQLLNGPLAAMAAAGVAALLFAALAVPFAYGMLGGGDVKLAPALALGFSPSGTWDFVVMTAAAGGMLGLLYIALSRLLPAPKTAIRPGAPLLQRVLAAERRRIHRRAGMPYGIAIAAGGVAMLLPKLLHGVP